MIDYQRMLLGKPVHVFTEKAAFEGIFEGVQLLGPFDEGSPFVVIKMDEDRTIFIPERLIERIDLAESIIPGEDGEGS